MLANYFAMNECHFQRWSPTLPADHHSIDSWKIRLDERELEFNKGVSVHVIGIDETESFVHRLTNQTDERRPRVELLLPAV